jgi:hypothetical protein
MRKAPQALAIAVVVVLVSIACGGEAVRFQAPSPSESPAATTAQVSPTPAGTPDPAASCTSCWPLNGKPLAAGAATDRRPLVVKIDNVPAARPHYGITQADIVVEELVEGFVTRLAAVYQSQDPQTIGGVRSARLADRSLTQMFRGALVYSGTSDYAKSLITQDAKSGRYVDLSADYTDGYYRVAFRPGPYNLFTSAAAHRSTLKALKADTVNGLPRWPFLASADHTATIAGMAGATDATELTLPYREDSSLVTYKYDPATRTYSRWQNDLGKPVRDVDAANKEPVAAANVIVINTEIWEVPEIVDAAGSHAHDMRLTGTGSATVFRDGLRQQATWSRVNDAAMFVFTNSSGEQIKLSQGQTWIHIIPTEWTVSSK